MSKLTKAQQKRMVRDILSKSKKLFLQWDRSTGRALLTSSDMAAVEKLTSKWLKRIG